MARKFNRVSAGATVVAPDGQMVDKNTSDPLVGSKWAPLVAAGILTETTADTNEDTTIPDRLSTGNLVDTVTPVNTATKITLSGRVASRKAVKVWKNSTKLFYGSGSGKFLVTDEKEITLGTAANGSDVYTIEYPTA